MGSDLPVGSPTSHCWLTLTQCALHQPAQLSCSDTTCSEQWRGTVSLPL